MPIYTFRTNSLILTLYNGKRCFLTLTGLVQYTVFTFYRNIPTVFHLSCVNDVPPVQCFFTQIFYNCCAINLAVIK